MECHTPSPIPGQVIQTAPASRGKEIEFPPSKTGLQIPINRSLESLQSIKFHLPRWSGQSGSSFHTPRTGTHEHTYKHVRMHRRKMHTCDHEVTCTKRQIHTQSNKCKHTHAGPLLSAPNLASTINNPRHCGACDPVTFDLWR